MNVIEIIESQWSDKTGWTGRIAVGMRTYDLRVWPSNKYDVWGEAPNGKRTIIRGDMREGHPSDRVPRGVHYSSVRELLLAARLVRRRPEKVYLADALDVAELAKTKAVRA